MPFSRSIWMGTCPHSHFIIYGSTCAGAQLIEKAHMTLALAVAAILLWQADIIPFGYSDDIHWLLRRP